MNSMGDPLAKCGLISEHATGEGNGRRLELQFAGNSEGVHREKRCRLEQ